LHCAYEHVRIRAVIEPVLKFRETAMQMLPRQLVKLAYHSALQDSLYVLVATGRAAHDSIRPMHLLDVLKALFFGRELYEDFPHVYWLGMNSLWHDTNFPLCPRV
jgi:hypothetical protein